VRKLTFIETNDIHWRLANPRARLDNYNDAMAEKIREIFAMAQVYHAVAILIPGDITDTPGLSLNAITELAALLDQSPCPILAIAGQHDQWEHNPETLYRTPFGLLRRLGYIQDVDNNEAWFSIGDKQVRISGRHYDTDADGGDNGYYNTPPTEDGIITIHLAHGLVMESKPGFDIRCTPLSDLKTDADVLCVGDYHPGIGYRQIGKSMIINPGALGRLSAGIGDMTRTVQVSKIEVYEDGEIKMELLPLECARPGSEVLSRDYLTQELEREDRTANFLSLLASEGESRFLSTREIVEDIARRDALPLPVIQDSLRRISEAREALQGRVA
jgi:DNA repair exonuclease SbcCD nuclease subunit